MQILLEMGNGINLGLVVSDKLESYIQTATVLNNACVNAVEGA